MALEGHSEFSSDGYVHALLAVVKMGAFFFQRPGPGPGPGPAVLFQGPAWPGPSRSFSRPRAARAAQSWPGHGLRPL